MLATLLWMVLELGLMAESRFQEILLESCLDMKMKKDVLTFIPEWVGLVQAAGQWTAQDSSPSDTWSTGQETDTELDTIR